MPRVRLQDVAEHAGVSMKTVSNVVNDFPHVTPQTRERVRRSIEALGYRPNATARRLVTGRTGTLALAVSDVSLPYFGELASKIARLASARGYRLLLEQTGDSVAAEKEVLLGLENGLIDGLIFQPAHLDTEQLSHIRANAPVVLLGENAAPAAMDGVTIDNISAARTATEHLIQLGRRRVAFVGHEAAGPSETSRQRLSGFAAALTDAGIDPRDRVEIPTAAISPHAALAAVTEALEAGRTFDGVFCRDDLSALGTLRALRLHDLRVPEDVAVVGWDDLTVAQFSHPTLTTIRPDLERLALVALDLLESRISGGSGPGRHVVVGHTLVVRESAP